MPLPLPQLDDRRWTDLVDEGRSLIPLYAPGWTDHNVHDPGITLVELLAWVAEMDLYRLNRVPPSHIRKFLALAGIAPLPPRGARTVLAVRPSAGVPHVDVPAGLEVEAQDLAGRWTVFTTLAAVSAVHLDLQAVQVGPQGIEDLTARWRRGETVPLLGEEPAPGAALYLGFDRPLPPGVPVTLYFRLAGGRSGWDERERLLEAARRAAEACPPPGPVYSCHCAKKTGEETGENAEAPPSETVPPHASARTVWEIQVAPGVWRRLDAEAGEIADETRSLTLDGRVVVTAPVAAVPARVGPVKAPLHYLRCLLVGGSYDAAPELAHVVVNGVTAEQAETVTTTWKIATGATIAGPLPAPGEERALVLSWNANGEIKSLQFLMDGEPRRRVLRFVAPTVKPGSLTVEPASVGTGNGEPFQRLTLPQAPVLGAEIELVVYEEEGLVTWTARPDFDLSGRAASHFVHDAQQGLLTFGDGEAGRRLPSGAPVSACYRSTRGADGNFPAGLTWRILATPHNEALPGFGDIAPPKKMKDEVAEVKKVSVANPAPAEGGAAAETLAAAAARAVDSVEQPLRAVTLADYEALALATPGVRLARAAARANLDPALPCLQATGVITVIILPSLPRRRPSPSAGTRSAVARFLGRHRVIGTRIVVVGPEYLEIAVRAGVRPFPGVDPAGLRERIAAALDRFFHPLTGGPDGTGWPFGRDVYRSEVLQLLDEVPGVDHVTSLELVAGCGCGGPVCGNVCVGPIGLVASGRHEITIG